MTKMLRHQRFKGIAGEIPIDTDYLDEQVPELAGTHRHASYYLAQGVDSGLNPTRFFLTDWYAWQNPDCLDRHGAPYLHYLDVGLPEGRDPSPFVDVVRYLDATGGSVMREGVYGAILAGLRAPVLGVYDSASDLWGRQRDFMAGISVYAHRTALPTRPRRALVVCQAGRGALLDGWAKTEERNWDLLINYYDAKGFRHDLGDYAVFQKGTKFTGMKLLIERFPEIISQYDHVLFLDDDVETTAGDLDALFAACRHHGLDLAQMSLTPSSSCNWEHLFSRPGTRGTRRVSAVEIMMPVFSKRALGWIAPTLGQSVSGFGLDLVWGHIVAENGGRIAVLDEVAATHARPVDQSGGAYYRYLRGHGINAKAELWTLVTQYGADRELVSL